MNLLTPLPVGRVEAPSRVVFGPHETNLGEGRAFSDRHVAYYRRRAAGGAGIIVTEEASVHRSDWPYERAPDASVAGPGWAAIGRACQPLGALVVAAIGHSGGQGSSAFSQRELWAPSDEPEVNSREVPKIMEQADIDAVVAGFADAARCATEAGLDGVEVNAGQHSLVRQFLSGLTNRRGDGYGQDRALFARQVLVAVRQGLGPDPLLGLRLSCDEMAPWAGITPEAATDLVRELSPLVDYLVVVRGAIFTVAETRPTGHHGTGFNLALAASMRDAAGGLIPVVAQGSIVDQAQADDALAAGQCDAVEMTRAQIADPDLVAKLRRRITPRPCVLCNQWCRVRDNRNPIVSCIAEPRSGHETTDPEPPLAGTAEAPAPAPAAGPARPGTGDVLVVGAGPAGLEAARVAARSGHRVRLIDAADRPGGMALVAAALPGQARFADLVTWLVEDALDAGVDLQLGTPVGADVIGSWDGPVILATGSVPGPPSCPSAAGATVLRPETILAARPDDLDALVPAEVAVWDPVGGPVAVGVAEILARAGRRVTFVTPDPIAGTLLSLTGDLAGANVRLQQAGVAIERREDLRRIDPDALVVEHRFSGLSRHIAAGAVVDCGHRLPEESLWSATGPDRGRIVRVGDSVAPRTVGDAIREGRAAGLALARNPIGAGRPAPASSAAQEVVG